MSASGENPTHTKYLEDIIISNLFICIEHPLFETQKSCVSQEEEEPRQAGTVQGTEETLKKNNVCCVVSWSGFGIVIADLFSETWTGTARMSTRRIWNILVTPVNWLAFLHTLVLGHSALQELQTSLWLKSWADFFGVVGPKHRWDYKSTSHCFKCSWVFLKELFFFFSDAWSMLFISTESTLCWSTGKNFTRYWSMLYITPSNLSP